VLVEGRRSVLGIGSTFPEAAESFWDADRLTREWLSSRPILLVTTRDPERSLVARMPRGRVHLLASRQGRWLWSNVPPGRSRLLKKATCEFFSRLRRSPARQISR